MKNAIDVKRPTAAAALGIVMMSMSLILAGCCKGSASIEQKQARLQTMVEAHAQRIARTASRIEQSRQEPSAEINHVQNSARLIAADMAAVADAQMKMQEILLQNNQYFACRPAVIEPTRQHLHVEVCVVQSNTQAVPGL